MARIRSFASNTVRTDTDNIIVTLPDVYATGDLLMIFIVKDDSVGGAFSTPAGWTAGGTDGAIGSGANSIRANYFYKIAASTSETAPTVTSTDADTWSAISVAIYGHDGSTPIDVASAATTQLTGNPYVAPSVTTTTNNALLLRVIGSDGSVAQMPEPGFVMVETVDGAADAICLAYDLQTTAGATPTCDFYAQGQADESLTWTIAIRDGSGGTILPGVPSADCATIIRPFNGNALAISGDAIDTNSDNFSQLAGTWQNPSLVYQVDASPLTFTDVTAAATNATDADVEPFPTVEATGDYFAVGFSSQPRSIRIDRLGCTQGVGGSCAREYLSTSGVWKSLPESFDATSNFTSALADHQISGFTPPADFTSQALNGQNYFWIRWRCTTVYTTNPTISQVFVSTQIALQHFTLANRANAGFLPAYDSLNLSLNLGGNSMMGGAYSVPAAINLSSAKILGTYLYDSPADHLDTSPRNEGGICVSLVDSTNKVKAWTVGARNSKDAYPGKRNIYLIQTNQSTDTSFLSSSPTLSDVRKFLFMNNCKFSQPQLSHTSLINVGTLKISGGGSTTPVDFTELVRVANGFPLPMIDEITNIAYVPIQIGGDRPVNLQISGATLGFPTQATEANKRTSFHCDPGVAGLIYDLRAGDTCLITTSKFFGGSPWQLTVPATASASATFASTGTVYDNAIVNWRYFALSSVTFSNCTVFNLISGSLTGCSIIATKIVTAVFSNIVNSTFTSGGSGHAIEITTPGTYTSDRKVFAGYGADGTTDAALYNNSGSHVEINLQNYTDQIPTVRNGAGATTTINALPKNISVTGAVSGSRILVRNETTNTVISNAVGTGYSGTYAEGTSFTAGDSYSVTVTNVNKLEKIYTGVVSSIGFSVLITQDNDTVYIDNGFDGSTFTGITFNTTTIDLDLDGSTDPVVLWGETYARYKYQTTLSAGIQTLVGAMFAKDGANYLFANAIVINNLSATPVKIGGDGFAARRDGGTMFGTGNIQIDNSVGVIIAESEEITAIKAKTDQLIFNGGCVDSNIERVNNLAITGTGTASDPWGPQ